MKKRPKHQKPNQTHKRKEIDDIKMTLGDFINQDMLSKLKEAQNELTEKERFTKEQEEQRKKEERRQREKNKSFEDLLNESTADWRKFK
ncbi:YqkE family protein [Peribacillus deserti]|uniref:DUF3886 domain-containing protein n=1 Tax=Peribacillus deserti TaxID=673318 RepID=A0A2N5M1L3_9BACI|nr:YqkE family protein [Peribacillus deserti]PLT28256.1 DUF3886 domain-containing protein [Peribacillus deserti]